MPYPFLKTCFRSPLNLRSMMQFFFFVAFSLTDLVSCGFAFPFFSRVTSTKNATPKFFFWALSREPYRLVLFVSTASVAASFRSGCGSFRRPPATRTHRFPTPTPHVGQATEVFSFAVSCFILIVASVVLECGGWAVVVLKT